MQQLRSLSSKLGPRWIAWACVATAFVAACVLADLSKAKAQSEPGSTTTTIVTTGAPNATGATGAVGPAGPSGTVKATSPIVSDLLDWMLKLVGIAAITAAPLLLQRWLGPKVSADRLATFTQLAVQGVAHAEEMGHQAIKSGAPKLDAGTKSSLAINYVANAADALKLKPLAELAVKNLITSALGDTRSPSDAGTAPLFPAGK